MPYFSLILIYNMATDTGFITELNNGKLTPEVLGELSTDLIINVKKGITQKFHYRVIRVKPKLLLKFCGICRFQ